VEKRVGDTPKITVTGRCAPNLMKEVERLPARDTRKINSRAQFVLAAWVVALMLAAPFSGLAQDSSTPQAASSAEHDIAEGHLGRGYAALKNDRLEEAAEEFRAALKLDPNLLLRARFPLATALFELHRPAQARREFETVRREVGDHPNVMYYLGRLDLTEGKFDDAVDKLTEAAAKPPFPDTDYYLAYAYLKRGDTASAEKWFREASELNPQDSRAEYQLGRLYRNSGRQDEAQKAFALSEEVRQREDENSRLDIDCNQKVAEGSVEAAHSACEQLFDPNDPEKLATLGTIYGQHGFYEEAVKPLLRAAELSPNSPQMQYNLALDYFRLKRYQEARVPLAKAVIRWPDLFELNALYGAVLYRLNERQAAYSVLRHAHVLNPQETESRDLLYRVSMLLAQQSLAAKQFAVSLRYLGEAARLRQAELEPHHLMVEIFDATGEGTRAAEERKEIERLSIAEQRQAGPK
jgi:type IV pilus assembly protein PilF